MILAGLLGLALFAASVLFLGYGVWLMGGHPLRWLIRNGAKTAEQKARHWQQVRAECRSFCCGVWDCIRFIPRLVTGLFKVAFWLCGTVIVLVVAGWMFGAVYEASTVKALLFSLVVTPLMAVAQAKR